MTDRLPRPGRHLHRGRAAARRRRATSSSRCGRRPIHDAILAVERGEAERALVPFENSIEGSVRSTLDTLAFDAEAVTIVGEHDFARAGPPDRPRGGRARAEIEAVLSHPQPLAQCARFLREHLPGVERRSVSSTAAAVRMVSESARPWAAIGARAAAELYGCTILARGDRGRGRQRHPLRLDRPGRDRAGGRGRRGRPRWSSPSSARTTPARWSTRCSEFSSRGVNLTRIESRPLRRGLGRYMFFCDLEGALDRRGRRRGDRGAAQPRPSRCGSSAPTRSP